MLLSVALPVKSAPSWSRTRALSSARLTLPTTLTASSTPPLLVNARSAPPAHVTVPPVIVPPARRHVPVVAVSGSVAPVLSRLPVRFTVPPLRAKFGRLIPAVVNVPPRFSVELVTFIVPAFAHVPPVVTVAPLAVIVRPAAFVQLAAVRLTVPPGIAVMLPLFVNVVPPPTVSVAPFAASSAPLLTKIVGSTLTVPPEMSAAIVPLLITRLDVPPVKRLLVMRPRPRTAAPGAIVNVLSVFVVPFFAMPTLAVSPVIVIVWPDWSVASCSKLRMEPTPLIVPLPVNRAPFVSRARALKSGKARPPLTTLLLGALLAPANASVPVPLRLIVAPLIVPPLNWYVPAETLIVGATSVPPVWSSVAAGEASVSESMVIGLPSVTVYGTPAAPIVAA